MSQYKTYSDAEILRQAEALRSETIRVFFASLFTKQDKTIPAHAVPAE